MANDDNFWHGETTESELELIKTIKGEAINSTDVEQTWVMTLDYTKSDTWSKTDNYSFSEKVSVEKGFKWPKVNGAKYNISFDATQSFGSQTGGTTSETVSNQVRVVVPPGKTIVAEIKLWSQSISYPYRFDADLSYDISFNGFLRYSGNAWITHPTNRPNKKHTFTIGRDSDKSRDIDYQWEHRYIPGEAKWWDWSWTIEQYGLNSMHYATGRTLRPFHSYVSGNFYAESQYASATDISYPEKPNSVSSMTSDNITEEQINGVTIKTNFDAQELDRLGIKDAQLRFSVVP